MPKVNRNTDLSRIKTTIDLFGLRVQIHSLSGDVLDLVSVKGKGYLKKVSP